MDAALRNKLSIDPVSLNYLNAFLAEFGVCLEKYNQWGDVTLKVLK